MGVPIGVQVLPLSVVWKICEYMTSEAEAVATYVAVIATAVLGRSGRTATSTTLWLARPPPAQPQSWREVARDPGQQRIVRHQADRRVDALIGGRQAQDAFAEVSPGRAVVV